MVDIQLDDIVPCVVRPIIQDWPQSGKDYERKLNYLSISQGPKNFLNRYQSAESNKWVGAISISGWFVVGR